MSDLGTSRTRFEPRTAAIALSLANLAFVPVWLELLFRDDKSAYYLKRLPGSVDFFAAVFVVLALAAILYGLAVFASRSKVGRVLWTIAFVAALAIPLNALRLKLPREIGVGRILSLGSVVKLAMILGAAAIAYAIYRFRARLVPGVRGGVAILAPFAALTILRASWAGVSREEEPRMEPKPFAAAVATSTTSEPSFVVWMIFDELDYRLAFEQRPPQVELPEFDRLRAQAVFATQALPPSNATLKSIPSLITGRVVDDADVKGPDDLWLSYHNAKDPVPWSRQDNVFRRARAIGADTALVGWYHPYCRILAADLSRCAFTSVYQTAIGRMDTHSFVDSVIAEAAAILPTNGRRLHIESYQQIVGDACYAVHVQHDGLLYLHLPVPHPPSVYDPAKNETTVMSWSNVTGYLGNLELADRALGEIRSAMEKAGTWDRATVIASADHPWRQSTAHDGKKDARVPFLVKLPGQKTTAEYSAKMETVITAKLVIEVLQGRISTAESLTAWLATTSP